MDQKQLNDLAIWVQDALAHSSMSLKGTATRGAGIRRQYEAGHPDPKFVVLEGQLLNGAGQGVYIGNPFYEVPVCKNGIGLPGLNGPFMKPEQLEQTAKEALVEAAKLDPIKKGKNPDEAEIKAKAAELDPQTSAFPGSDKIMRWTIKGPNAFKPMPSPEDHVRQGSKLFSRKSLRDTIDKDQDSFYGDCDGFTCVIVSALADTRTFTVAGGKNPILKNTTIEVVFVNLGTKTTNRGHTFSVINRPPNSDLKNPTTWGPSCFVIDHWYGLQKVMAGQRTTSIYWPSKIEEGGPDSKYFDDLKKRMVSPDIPGEVLVGAKVTMALQTGEWAAWDNENEKYRNLSAE